MTRNIENGFSRSFVLHKNIVKSGQADKKFARELESLIAAEAAHRRERSASFSLSRNTATNNLHDGPSATTDTNLATSVTGNKRATTISTNTNTDNKYIKSNYPDNSPSYTDDENESSDHLSLPTSPLLTSTKQLNKPNLPATSIALSSTSSTSNTQPADISSPQSPSQSTLSPRTLSYLINTLNNSYPDYDFGDLRSHNFLRISELSKVMNTVNSSLSELAIEENRYPTLPQEIEEMVLAKKVSTQQIALANNTNSNISNSTTNMNNNTTTITLQNFSNDLHQPKRKRGRPSSNNEVRDGVSATTGNVHLPISSAPVNLSITNASSHPTGSTAAVVTKETTSSSTHHHVHHAKATSNHSSTATTPASNTGTFFLDTYWSLIDSKIQLSNCEIYSLLPDLDSDPLSEDALWSFNFFFLNRNLNRIVYIACVAHSTAYISSTQQNNRNTMISPLRRTAIQSSPTTETTTTNTENKPNIKKPNHSDSDEQDNTLPAHNTPEKRNTRTYFTDAHEQEEDNTNDTSTVGGGPIPDDQTSYISSQAGNSSSTTHQHTREHRNKKFNYLYCKSIPSSHYQGSNQSISEMYAGGIQGAIHDDQEEDNDVSDDLEYIDDEDDKQDNLDDDNLDDDDNGNGEDIDHDQDDDFDEDQEYIRYSTATIPSQNIPVKIIPHKRTKILQNKKSKHALGTEGNKHTIIKNKTQIMNKKDKLNSTTNQVEDESVLPQPRTMNNNHNRKHNMENKPSLIIHQDTGKHTRENLSSPLRMVSNTREET